MISVYTDADYLSAYKQKQRIFRGFFIITAVYVAICVAMLVYHITLPYAAKEDWVPKLVTYVSTAAYFIFIFPYMAIKFRRCRKYCQMLHFISEGLKVEETNYFYTFCDRKKQSNEVDVTSCAFEIWNKKFQEWREREVYFDKEKPLPEFGSGDYIRYVSHNNVLLQYEILEKHAYEFTEYIEEDEEEETEEGTETAETAAVPTAEEAAKTEETTKGVEGENE